MTAPTRKLIAQIPDDLHVRTKAFAEATERSIAAVVRMALRSYLDVVAPTRQPVPFQAIPFMPGDSIEGND